MTRIMRLLALAGSPNRHEAESAMREAQRLMLKHNLDLKLPSDPGTQRYAVRHVGRLRGRLSEAHNTMEWLLQVYFFVKAGFVGSWDPFLDRHGLVLELCGTPANLDMASYVHDFIWHTAERLWEEYRNTGGDARLRESFMAGLLDGFAETLQEQRKRHEAEGLVWRGDRGLAKFYDRLHPPIQYSGPWSWSDGASHGAARTAGQQAGRSIRLHRPVHEHGRGGHLLRG